MRRGKDPRRTGLGSMRLRRTEGSREAERDAAAMPHVFSHRLSVLAVGALVGVVLHPLGPTDVLDWRIFYAAASTRSWIFARFRRPFYVPAFGLAGGIGLGGAIDPVDALSSHGGATPAQTGVRSSRQCYGVAPRTRPRPTSPFPIGVMAGIAAMIARALGETLTERRTMAGHRRRCRDRRAAVPAIGTGRAARGPARP